MPRFYENRSVHSLGAVRRVFSRGGGAALRGSLSCSRRSVSATGGSGISGAVPGPAAGRPVADAGNGDGRIHAFPGSVPAAGTRRAALSPCADPALLPRRRCVRRIRQPALFIA
ncbi:hypothetical protein SDC9_171941 [bioreactor metagenome]|uniref:Uncharacterized protein n=1 Tax=bioreactor metagenome TaxID=1076179 RepID=A0A645GEU5_9ZZZZ